MQRRFSSLHIQPVLVAALFLSLLLVLPTRSDGTDHAQAAYERVTGEGSGTLRTVDGEYRLPERRATARLRGYLKNQFARVPQAVIVEFTGRRAGEWHEYYYDDAGDLAYVYRKVPVISASQEQTTSEQAGEDAATEPGLPSLRVLRSRLYFEEGEKLARWELNGQPVDLESPQLRKALAAVKKDSGEFVERVRLLSEDRFALGTEATDLPIMEEEPSAADTENTSDASEPDEAPSDPEEKRKSSLQRWAEWTNRYRDADRSRLPMPADLYLTEEDEAAGPVEGVPHRSTVDGLNVRNSPSTRARAIETIRRSDTVYVTGEAESGWLPITLEDGRTGYVSQRYLEETGE